MLKLAMVGLVLVYHQLIQRFEKLNVPTYMYIIFTVFWRFHINSSKIEKVPRGIRGEKSSKDMASSRNLVSTIGALASPKMVVCCFFRVKID